MLSKDEVVSAVPTHLRSNITDDFVNKVNSVSTDPEVAEQIRNNFVSYASILREGRFKTEDYLNAVAYVSFKLMGYNNEESYARTFPQRHAALKARGASNKDISAYVAAYNKNKLVNLIFEQTFIPTWVMNQDIYQEAINTQADLMMNARSEKVRSDAANSILTHLKKPEKKEVDLNIGVQENTGMVDLKNLLTDLAERQQQAIEQGLTTREIAHQPLISAGAKGEIIDVEAVPVDEQSEAEDTQ